MRDYLEWQSKLTLEDVFASHENISYPSFFNDGYVYLTQLADQKGRSVLIYADGNSSSCITPRPLSLRTKINEYGGKPYWVFQDQIVFANNADQCLYRQFLNLDVENRPSSVENLSKPERITPKPDSRFTYMYSDVSHLTADYYIAIIEVNDAQKDASDNRSYIGLIDASQPNASPKVLVDGADFYNNLVHTNRVDEHKTQVKSTLGSIAWVQWSHPSMPWDENQLKTAELATDLSVSEVQNVVANNVLHAQSYCQLAFKSDGKLLFSVDFARESGFNDFWNIYEWCPHFQTVQAITQETCEFGYPHWQYGDCRITALSDGRAIAIGSSELGDSLFLLNSQVNEIENKSAQKKATYNKVYDNNSSLQHLASNDDNQLLVLETTADNGQCLLKFDVSLNVIKREPLKSATQYEHPVSIAKAISYPCRDKQLAHAFYYPPINHEYSAKQGGVNSLGVSELGLADTQNNNAMKPPPLLVMVHGGPTARAYSHFDIQKQFWCSNGFAVFDVNHRGSSGFGRNYRDALYAQWGLIDTSDIVDGIDWLVGQGLADADRVCIRGKSAGGYAVLRALTDYPSKFKAGSCYYGIGNLATLAEVTHKFEKHYTDRLIDEPYDKFNALKASSHYYQRSPIHKIDQIVSAMIIFQGGQDNVVPPAIAHEMVDKLKANKIPHEYVEYPDEGHGFRQIDNNIDAWSRELNFYRKYC